MKEIRPRFTWRVFQQMGSYDSDLKELVSELKGLRSDVAAGTDINIDGNAMGKYLSLAAHKSTTA